MKFVISVLSLVILIGFTSCNSSNSKKTKQNDAILSEVGKTATTPQQSEHQFSNQGVVQKVLQTSGYTYVLVKSGNDTSWLAVNKMPVKQGETLYYDNGLEMSNFHSRALNRTFAKLALIQNASTSPGSKVGTSTSTQMEMTPIKPNITEEKINVKPQNGSITIAELYANKKKYSGKVIKVRGKVTRFNEDIMDRNWVHIQDGTKSGSNYDLAITTQDRVRTGDVVTFEGKITLNKDFGAGYFYSVIMQKAKVLK